MDLSYSPEIKIDIFSDHLKNNESNTVVNLPLEKNIGQDFAVNLGVTFDLTRLSPKDKSAVNNTMWYISPSVLYKSPTSGCRRVFVRHGIIQLSKCSLISWLKWVPMISALLSRQDGRVISAKQLINISPRKIPGYGCHLSLLNTWIEERFAGFKGSVGDHFTYSAKVGFNKLNNQPLFINDTTAAGDGKSFRVVNAKRVNVLNLGGELGYNVEEKFSVITSLSFNQYTGLQDQQKAWGLLPLEFNTALRLQIIKDLWLKGDLFALNGSRYLEKDGDDGKLKGAVDLNAGLEFKIQEKYQSLDTVQ